MVWIESIARTSGAMAATCAHTAGNDVYQTAGFSLGAAAHNGLVVFVDDAGDDVYRSPLGRASPNDYHGGHSFALAIDASGRDTYGRTQPEVWNDRVSLKEDRAYVLDLPDEGAELRALLR